MTHRRFLILFLSALCAILVLVSVQSSGAAQVRSAANGKKVRQAPQTDGERVFQQNCSRCHAAPEGFSPSIAGTVARHMRVRASLSREDEEALLRFLNP